MPVDEYLLIFNEEEFTEFNEVANRLGHETQFLREMIPKFFVDRSRCETEGNCYILDMDRLDYCMMLLKIKQLKPQARIANRIAELGFTQDAEFRAYIDALERDLRRYRLHGLH